MSFYCGGGINRKDPCFFFKNVFAKNIFCGRNLPQIDFEILWILMLTATKKNEKEDPKNVDAGAQKTKADKSNFCVRYSALLNPVTLIILIIVKLWTCSFLNNELVSLLSLYTLRLLQLIKQYHTHLNGRTHHK